MLRSSCVFTSALALLSFTVLAQNPRSNPTQTITQDPNDWPMYNHDVVGTRFNPAEATLTPESVRGLKIKWIFPTAGDVFATPSVVSGIVYAGDTSGSFYALTISGALLWKTKVNGPITDSALLTNGPGGTDGMVIFGDQAGYIYALKRSTGDLVWSVHPNPNATAAIFGSPILANGQVVIGISSNEGKAKGTFRGSVVSLDPDNKGNVNWQTYLITEDEQKSGASGAGVWSTPTYDAESDIVYVTTGNNYANPATTTSDAFVALNGSSGKIVWTQQFVKDDTGTVEADIGDSPQVYTLLDGEKVVGAGEKETGVYSVLDAADGRLVRSIQAVPSCAGSEGLFADSAISNGVVFVNGVNCDIPSKSPLIPPTGAVVALKSDASKKLWNFTSFFAPVLSGVAVANGVVYFHASGIFSVLYALDANTGQMLAGVLTSGAISGPSVSHGQIYVGTGTKFASGVPTPSGIVAIGL
ncbi:MAG: PQQ-binding-like beta-propeller repeat protein [Verrucomicrobia bacterium]|nr:PQQ-binding-like beta-propeller repeat protein [Verrucomicrobiota bacterium]